MTEAKRADFKIMNASDNPMDENGKTARDRELERNQGNPSVQPEFARTPGTYGDAQNEFNKAAANLDPRNRQGSLVGRGYEPGVDKPQGGSSDDAMSLGRERSGSTYPLPNPNNPDSPNNPVSTATRDMLGNQSSPPLPTGARTTPKPREPYDV